ncbi:MAG: GMC family oxidoreductase [Thermoleophilia bacterium]|nr:GMC family oxidoreductase [Thermoleophilia bacterium]
MPELASTTGADFDYDYLIVGSGFGGSVSALRLAEKGYRVGVLECGRRYRDSDHAETAWDMRRYFWAPLLGLRGILRLTLFKDVFIASGCGVGGGSLGYANTLYWARDSFYGHDQWLELSDDWGAELKPHYDTAERMLGVTTYDDVGPADELLREYAEQIGVGDTWGPTRVGVFLGEPGVEVEDPYFGGEGPRRSGCIKCGSCMVGCRNNAKNNLPKNYLWFAERLGAEVMPERQATSVRPLGPGDGSAGYEVVSERSGAWLRKRRRRLTARAVVVAAGALGTNRLLRDCKEAGDLPRLSERLGHMVRTNSESIMAVTAPDDARDFANSIAITSSIYPQPDTHVEVVTYGRAGDAMSGLYTLMTGEGGPPSRMLQWAAAAVRRPGQLMRIADPRSWSRRTVILLVMQTLDNALRLVPKKKLVGSGVKLQTEEDPAKPNPRYIPAAADVTRWMADRIGGIPSGGVTESLFNIPTTAHILGGAVISTDATTGVVDGRQRVHGYENLLVCDGAAMPANPGVNPSLTITAMAERAMSFVPPREGAEPGHLPEQARPASTPAQPTAS